MISTAAASVAQQLASDAAALAVTRRSDPYSDRLCPPAETVARVRPLLGQFGITRLANITGLDRIGIPVWTAVRPNARTLAISQGKGRDDASAKASAVMEALELAVAERPALTTCRCTADHLLANGEDVELLEDLTAHGHADPRRDDETVWTPGYDLIRQCTTWVPVEAATIDQTVDAPAGRYWQSSDGLASGNLLIEAVLHGLLERIERDATVLWRLRPAGEVQARCVHPDSFHDPLLSALTARVEQAGLRLRLFDITSDIGVPAFLAAIGRDDARGRRYWKHFDLACGTGSHPVPVRAAIRALTEAAQTRLTTIAGSRDDFLPDLYEADLAPDLYAYLDTQPRIREDDVIRLGASVDAPLLNGVLERLAIAGIGRVIVVPLSAEGQNFVVAKVLVPELEHPPGDRRRRFGRRALGMMIRFQ